MKMWPRHDLENKVTSHEPKVIETSNLRLPGEKLEMQLYVKIGSLSETELAKKTTWGVAPPPRCGRGLNSIQCIGVISNNTKYKKFIKSRYTLQPYSWQGINWGFLVLITPTIEIKLDLTSNLIENLKKIWKNLIKVIIMFCGLFLSLFVHEILSIFNENIHTRTYWFVLNQ